MYCPSCGDENRPDATTCSRCAAPLPYFGPRYRVLRVLGTGGKKRVYVAYDSRLDREVAIAVVETTDVSLEARAMGRLGEHPNVATIYDIGEHDGRAFIVTEVVAGGDLGALLERSPGRRLPIRDAARIADQIASALEHAHGHGIVHRDVKPGNVWLDAHGVAKLGDFGLAVPPGDAPGGEATVAGTAAYMSPEQARGGPIDARTDLYALGAVLYEMVAGRPPFVADDAADVIAQHAGTPPRPPSALVPGIPPALDALILRLLAKSPADRLPDATAVRRALAALTPPDRETLDWPRRAPVRRRWPWRAAVAILVVGGVLVAVPMLQRDTPRPRATVGVMSFTTEGPGPEAEWTRRVTRDGLNAILSKVEELRVYAKEMIDFKREKYGLSEVEVAQDLGITKMVSGTITLSATIVSVEMRLIDVRTGVLEASITRARPRDELIALQNELAGALLAALGVAITPARADALFGNRKNEMLKSYRSFYDTLGDVAPPGDSRAAPRPWRFALGGVAHAAEDDEGAIRAVLEAYRLALEAEDVTRLASLHLDMTDRQRDGLARYFAGARDLHVRLSAIDIAVAGDEALVSYTREDDFRDARSGSPVHVETRISRLLAKRDGAWKIGNRKDPS